MPLLHSVSDVAVEKKILSVMRSFYILCEERVKIQSLRVTNLKCTFISHCIYLGVM
jgi:hypothetical protein